MNSDNYTILDRNGNEFASGSFDEIAGEENNLLTDADFGGQAGEWYAYNSPMQRGEARDYIWQRTDGSEVIVGSLVKN
jgi:hypothetical protein